MKICYFLCLMFCIYSLNTFVQESYLVAYAPLLDHHEPIHRLDCRRLSDLSLNKTKYSMSQLKEDLVRHFENRDYIYVRYRWGKENYEKGKQHVLNRTKSGDFLILNEMVCFIMRNKEDKNAMIWFLGDLPRLLFAYRKDPFDWTKMNYPGDRFIQIILLKKQRPYSNCVPGYCRFRCLNECYKNGFRLSKYYYEANETGLIHLNEPMNRSVELHEKNCQSKCKRLDCKLVYLFVKNSEPVKDTNDTNIMYKSRRVLKQFDYWTQLVGLLSSFTSISFYPLLSSLSTFAIMKIVRRIKLRGSLTLASKLIILMVSLLCCAYLYHRIIMDYKEKVDNPVKKQTFTNLPKPEIIRLAVCIPFRHIFASYSGSLSYPYYDKMTLLQLEKATDRALDDLISGVYFDEQSKPISMKWMINGKVLFTNYRGFSRCFLLTIDPAYSKYQPMQPISKLKIRFKISPMFSLYLLPEKDLNHPVTQLYFNVRAELACRTLKKSITKRSKRKCVDYEAKYANCTNWLGCVERCVHQAFIRRHRNITIGPINHLFVVDRAYFSELEWSRSFLVKSEKNYLDLLSDCRKQIPDEPPCMESKFDKATIKLDQFTAEMNLEYEVTASMEEEPSDYQLALDILNIHNIFFAITILRVLGGICEFIRARLKLDPSSCASKTTLFFIYLLCLAGFTWHLWYLFKLTINSELTYTQNLEIAEESQSPLEIMFCYQIDQRLIDEHHKLTGNYLQQLTSDLHVLNVFRNVTYLNELNHWAEFDLSLVQTFFFTNKKCFKIRIDWSYGRERFRFVNDTQILRVNFNRTFIDGKGLTYFMTKANDRMRFSKKIDLDIRSTYPATHSMTPLDGYSISQELFVIRHDFQFNPIKKPLSSLYETDPNDFEAHQDQLLYNEYGIRSLDMPVHTADFRNELQDDLFELYYQQIRNLVNSNTQSRPDYEKEFIINRHSTHSLQYESPFDFTFSLVYLKKVIVISDEDTYTKLTLAVLNVLFLWFDLGVFDLAFNAHCICSALFHWIKLISICERLSKSKRFLYKSLHDHLYSSLGGVNSPQND